MKTCNDGSAPQAPAEELSAGERRALKRQLDSFVGDLARGLLGEDEGPGEGAGPRTGR